MKNICYLLLMVFCALIVVSGCDATDSVPVSTAAPVLVSPADTSTNISLTPTFTWTGNADKLDIGSNNTFTTIIQSASVTGTSYTLTTPLQANTQYFWRAGHTAGSTVYWCNTIFSFRTKP